MLDCSDYLSPSQKRKQIEEKIAGKIEESEDREAFLKELSEREAKEAKNLREFLRKVEKEQ